MRNGRSRDRSHKWCRHSAGTDGPDGPNDGSARIGTTIGRSIPRPRDSRYSCGRAVIFFFADETSVSVRFLRGACRYGATQTSPAIAKAPATAMAITGFIGSSLDRVPSSTRGVVRAESLIAPICPRNLTLLHQRDQPHRAAGGALHFRRADNKRRPGWWHLVEIGRAFDAPAAGRQPQYNAS